jgi:hypothetical protein
MPSKITLEIHPGNKVTVEVPEEGLNIHDLVDMLVRPALLGAGYAENSVDEALGREVQ